MSDGSAAFLSLHPNAIIRDKSEGMQMCFLGQPSSQPPTPEKRPQNRAYILREIFTQAQGK